MTVMASGVFAFLTAFIATGAPGFAAWVLGFMAGAVAVGLPLVMK